MDIEDLLRAADPGTVHRGDPLSPLGQEWLEFDRVLEAALEPGDRRQPSDSRSRRRRRRSMVVAGACVVVLVGFMVLLL